MAILLLPAPASGPYQAATGEDLPANAFMVRYTELEEAIWDIDDRSEDAAADEQRAAELDRITAEAQARVADAEQTAAATSIARAEDERDAGIRTAEHSADLARRGAEESRVAREEAARVRTGAALSAMSCAPLTAISPPACGLHGARRA